MNKHLVVMLVGMMIVTGTAYAGSFGKADVQKVNRVNACLNKASVAATTVGADGKITSQDNAKLEAGYCACYTAENDKNLMAFYCK